MCGLRVVAALAATCEGQICERATGVPLSAHRPPSRYFGLAWSWWNRECRVWCLLVNTHPLVAALSLGGDNIRQ